MSNETRWEFEQLKRRQARLESELATLAEDLKRLDRRLMERDVPPFPAQSPPVAPAAPIPSAMTGVAAPGSDTSTALPPIIRPPLPLPVPASEAATGGGQTHRSAGRPLVPPPLPKTPEPAEERSFEIQLGRHWAPRVGIVLVLTAFVFFANYAYQNFIIRLGPAGKVSLLYLGGAILLGCGTWWQRRGVKESLRNYAQVLFAGGLAAVYFTTYAAHHVENLRVIDSAVLDGILLLAWAGFMVWVADRRKSEVLALFAVGLAYYTSVITRVGSFTLYSNLVLTVAAVFFLVRNRWAGLSFVSLVATYAAYGFWRFFDGRQWLWTSPDQGLWHGTYFLVAYWIVFTAAVFLSRHATFTGTNRATFLTLNNAQFFILFLLTLLQTRHEWFWKFAVIYGAVLLVLAALARRVLAQEPLARNLYLTQGLLLITAGIIAKFAGLQLALLLGIESVVLFTLGKARKSMILETGAYLCGAMSVGWGIDGLERDDWQGALTGSVLGALMIFNAHWSGRLDAGLKPLIRRVPGFFAVLALISWFATTAYNTSADHFPLWLAAEALVLTLSIYGVRLRELTLFAQGYILIAHLVWLVRFVPGDHLPPWWNPVLLAGITIALSHWWQRQRVLEGGHALAEPWQAIYALALVGVLYFWLAPLLDPPVWLALTSGLAIVLTIYGVWSRWWWVAICAQIFLIASAWQFAVQLFQSRPDWYFPLAPVVALTGLAIGTARWFRDRPEAAVRVREPLLQVALGYRCLATLMVLWWVWEYVPAREQIWVLVLIGLLLFAWAGWRTSASGLSRNEKAPSPQASPLGREREASGRAGENPGTRSDSTSPWHGTVEGLLFSAVFSAAGLLLFWVPVHGAGTVYWPNLAALLIVLGQQRAARRFAERYAIDERVHAVAIVLGALSLALLLYRWLSESATRFYLTAAWSALGLALFSFGMVLRERVYRWVGLGVLAAALCRVVVVDVWKLNELYRILSFSALGLVLLILGFLYSKYQEKIKEWL